MKRYLAVTGHLFSFMFKTALSFRFNFILRLLYAPAYFGVFYLMVLVTFANIDYLYGISKTEVIMYYATFTLLYSIAFTFYTQGIRYYLWWGLRNGYFDFALLKPINSQFLFAFARPNVEAILVTFFALFLMIVHMQNFQNQITIFSLILFFLTLTISLYLHYLTFILYACAGFYATKAAQILEVYDKFTDYSLFPIQIFPASLRELFLTVVPMFFFAIFPVNVLLNEPNQKMVVWFLLITIFYHLFVNWIWKISIKQYSSASS